MEVKAIPFYKVKEICFKKRDFTMVPTEKEWAEIANVMAMCYKMMEREEEEKNDGR